MKGARVDGRPYDLLSFGRRRTAFRPPFTSVTRVQIPSGTASFLATGRLLPAVSRQGDGEAAQVRNAVVDVPNGNSPTSV